MDFITKNWYSIRSLLESIGVASIATGLSYIIAMYFGWVPIINWLEVAAVFTSYSCVYMCVKETRWNYPMGILTTALYSLVYFQAGLYAMAAFNLYLVFSLIYGFFRWGKDEDTKPITRLKLDKWLGGYVGLGFGIFALLMLSNILMGGTISNIEIWATVLSGVAQFMLDNKRLENWGVWAIVNVLSIYLYFTTGLYLVAIQYVFFLANTLYGFVSWYKSYKAYNKTATI